jgi:hypothetical protein
MQMSAPANTPLHGTLTLATGFGETVSYLGVISDTYSVTMYLGVIRDTYSVTMTWKICESVDSGRYKLVYNFASLRFLCRVLATRNIIIFYLCHFCQKSAILNTCGKTGVSLPRRNRVMEV